MPAPIKDYRPGENIQASTITYILRNLGISTQNGIYGGGFNAILQPPTNEQGMADLTDSDIDSVKAYSVIYCLPKPSGGYEWSKTKRPNAQAFYTLGNSSITATSTGEEVEVTTPTGSSKQRIPSPLEDHKMIAVLPMVPGQKYILHSQANLRPDSACDWNGEKLVVSETPANAEFFVQQYEWNVTSPPVNVPLLEERPRLSNPLFTVHEGYYDANGNWVPPGFIPDPFRNLYFADNVYPPNGVLPGFEFAQSGHISQLNLPLKYQDETELGYAEVIYRPVAEIESSGNAIVLFPIMPILTYADVKPRPNGSSTPDLDQSYADLVGAIDAAELGSRYSASFLAARCMGVVIPMDKEPTYLRAHYSSADLKARTDLKEVSVTSPWCRPQPSFADPITKTIPLYVRRMRVKLDKNTNAPIYESLVPEETDLAAFGFFKYEYDLDDCSPEIVSIPRCPRPSTDWIFDHCDTDGNCYYVKIPVVTTSNPSPTATVIEDPLIIPRQTPFGAGEWNFISSDSSGTCKWEFIPTAEQPDEDSRLAIFPFDPCVTSRVSRLVTTLTSRAQVEGYPAISRVSDYNEILVPGMEVEYTLETVELRCPVAQKYRNGGYYDGKGNDTREQVIKAGIDEIFIPFQYAVVTPPSVYHTDFMGTPKTKIVRIEIARPSEYATMTTKHMTDDDYWVDTCSYVDEIPDPIPPYHIYFSTPLLTDTMLPQIREPHGAFSDCENVSSLAVFERNARGTRYFCCARLNYIPYGYAIPTKIPSCFYKATEDENCAPRLKGYVYDVYRQDTELQVKGACYVPCSSLTQL